MMSFRSRATADDPAIQPGAFRQVMGRPAVARELFLPLDRAWWDGDRYTVGRWGRRMSKQRLGGVRLQEPHTGTTSSFPERDTQNDLSSLVRSVAELRKEPELSGVVLSDEALVGPQEGTIPGKRVVFGLHCPANGRFKGEVAAAKECHRVIRRAVDRAGFRVEHPRSAFNPAAGFSALLEWTGAIRLRRKRDPRWLLLLLPLALLPLLFLRCAVTPATLFGISVPTESFVILLDKSKSMGPYYSQVRDEARKLLEERSRSPDKLHFADLILYDGRAASALGGLQPVTPDNIAKMLGFVDRYPAEGGWTNLASAIDRAAEEVAQHGKQTTLIVLTDGEEDESIAQMIKDKDKVRAKFKSVPVNIRATTPRLFAGGKAAAVTDDEKTLDEFCKTFGGRFGPSRAVP